MKTDRKQTKPAKLSENSAPDRRLAKTRGSLSHALFALMQRHDWEDITAQDICDEANVARSSFYIHFGSKIALLDHTIENSLAQSREARKAKAGLVGFLEWIVDHVTADRNFFIRVARSQGAQVILNRFKSALRLELEQELKRANPATTKLHASYILGGVFDALIFWSTTWKTYQLPAVKAEIIAMSGRISAPQD
jgi:AcrR family transcriptional regulator